MRNCAGPSRAVSLLTPLQVERRRRRTWCAPRRRTQRCRLCSRALPCASGGRRMTQSERLERYSAENASSLCAGEGGRRLTVQRVRAESASAEGAEEEEGAEGRSARVRCASWRESRRRLVGGMVGADTSRGVGAEATGGVGAFAALDEAAGVERLKLNLLFGAAAVRVAAAVSCKALSSCGAFNVRVAQQVTRLDRRTRSHLASSDAGMSPARAVSSCRKVAATSAMCFSSAVLPSTACCRAARECG